MRQFLTMLMRHFAALLPFFLTPAVCGDAVATAEVSELALTEDDAVRLALRNNRTLIRADQAVAIDEAAAEINLRVAENNRLWDLNLPAAPAGWPSRRSRSNRRSSRSAFPRRFS